MTGEKIRVLVVDDSVVMRRLVLEVIGKDPELDVAGWASNGKTALSRIEQTRPDCVTLDLEMPEMGGLETLAEIRQRRPELPVILLSAQTAKGARQTFDAVAKGANDYVAKPSKVSSFDESLACLRDELLPRIKAHTRSQSRPAVPAQIAPVETASRGPAKTPRVICIAASTGGPQALTKLLSELPGDLPVPILIVQHMPPSFTFSFAERLDKLCALRIKEAVEGEPVRPSTAYIAPGGLHMTLEGKLGALSIGLNLGEPENSCRPAADVLFRSAAKAAGEHLLAVVLTGMGQDGLRGAAPIVAAGGRVLAQDQESSVVWGMPGYVSQAGLAEMTLPLDMIAGELVSRVVRQKASLSR